MGRLLAYIAALTLVGSCSLIFKEDATSSQPDDASVYDAPSVAYDAPTGAACTDDTDCQIGQECSSGVCVCTLESCPGGCCGVAGTCRQLSPTSCGPLGSRCEICDSDLADGCSEDGLCQCGDGASCEDGQRCDESGRCVCDSLSCAGCCTTSGVGGECRPGSAQTECGVAGAVCSSCTIGSCNSGACSGCADTCMGMTAGCCSGNTCIFVSDADPTACGSVSGEACQACGIGADRCSLLGECECGAGEPACLDGQECVGGICECNANSCPGGCCSPAGECIEAEDTNNNCGLGGQACELCAEGQSCDQDGECVCDPSLCVDGCCDSLSGQCIRPGLGADICDTGGALCETCPEGEFCDGASFRAGQCQCTPGSCSVDGECCNQITRTCETGGLCAENP